MPSTISYLNAELQSFPLSQAAVSLLLNSEFNDPFTGDENTGWQSSSGWLWNSAGRADSVNGQFLYRKISGLVVGGLYEARIGVTAVSEGVFYAFGSSQGALSQNPINAPGDYVFPFNCSVANDRYHLAGGGNFSGQIAYFRIIRI